MSDPMYASWDFQGFAGTSHFLAFLRISGIPCDFQSFWWHFVAFDEPFLGISWERTFSWHFLGADLCWDYSLGLFNHLPWIFHSLGQFRPLLGMFHWLGSLISNKLGEGNLKENAWGSLGSSNYLPAIEMNVPTQDLVLPTSDFQSLGQFRPIDSGLSCDLRLLPGIFKDFVGFGMGVAGTLSTIAWD
jgi:hypothetical protein